MMMMMMMMIYIYIYKQICIPLSSDNAPLEPQRLNASIRCATGPEGRSSMDFLVL